MRFGILLSLAALIAVVTIGCEDWDGADLKRAEKLKGADMSSDNAESADEAIKTDRQWREELTAEQYRVLRQKGTEMAFSGQYDHHFEEGKYLCAGCGEELFTSEAKYNSGCGWPAFTKPAKAGGVDETVDRSAGMVRTEITCSKCGGHLGHVFNDGPPEAGGLRYCINSASLEFDDDDDKQE